MAAEQPIRSRKIRASDRVCTEMRRQIENGAWPFGEKIPSEVALCEMYDVSRVTIRAAIQRLVGAGLLDSRQGGGTFVRPPSNADAINAMISFAAMDQPNRMDMFEFRRIMEVESVGFAALRAKASDVREMDKSVQLMRAAQTPEESARWDLEFHRLIAKTSDNAYIMRVFDVLKDAYYVLLCENTRIMGNNNGSKYHELICRAIEIRDVQMAQTYMKEHLTDTIKKTLTRMRDDVIKSNQ